MLNHHQAWLESHPERTAEWLSRQLAEGFEIHHRDNNHQNNDPLNLVLIERRDHLKLHGINALPIYPDHMRRAGRKGGVNSRKFVGKRKATQLAKRAAKARWAKPHVVEIKGEAKRKWLGTRPKP